MKNVFCTDSNTHAEHDLTVEFAGVARDEHCEGHQVLRPGEVAVGDGVTENVGSDRYAGTVTWVSDSGKTLRFTQDHSRANGPTHDREQHDYSYESVPERTWDNPLGQSQTNARTARWSEKRQRYVVQGCSFSLSAGRHSYRDPSF